MKNKKRVLVAGAGFAGLSTAWWLVALGYQVTIVEIGYGIRQGGAALIIRDETIDTVRRMGLFEPIVASRIRMPGAAGDDILIGRDTLSRMIFDRVHDHVEFIFGDGVAALRQHAGGIEVDFMRAARRSFDLVIGCDGLHSKVRGIGFGDAAGHRHPLGACWSITSVDKLLIAEHTSRTWREAGMAATLTACHGKTDLVLCFSSDAAFAGAPGDHRDEAAQRRIVADRVAGLAWRLPELRGAISKSRSFNFTEMCQIRMPSWSSGRVVLVGDAGYCASPAAGTGGALAIDGAGALADALARHGDDHALAFADYERAFRPCVDRVQAKAVDAMQALLVPVREGHAIPA